MSRASLKNFLEKLDKELKGSSATYRREADRREMSFYYHAGDLGAALFHEFEFRGLLKTFDKKEVQDFIKKSSLQVLKDCRASAKKIKAQRGVRIVSNQYMIKVSIAVEKNPSTDKAYINFTKLKEVYKESVTEFVKKFNTFLVNEHSTQLTKTKQKFNKETYKSSLEITDKPIDTGSDLFEAGHIKGEGILESRVRDAIDTAFNSTYGNKAKEEVLKSNLGALGINLEFVRDDTSDTHQIKAQAKTENRTTGFMSGEQKRELRKSLKAAVERLNDSTPVPGLKGSRSIQQVKELTITHAILQEFARKKNIKTSRLVKPKLEKRSASLSKDKKSNTVAKAAAVAVKVPKAKLKQRKPAQKGVAGSPLALIGMINKKLPDTVRKNMNPPALENRTGRFVDSVKLTDIVKTPQGFPSVGYTYAKNPYQVYEMGTGSAPWATPERDPRKLIDRSIREIAAQFAIGRFYTRRV